MQKWEKFHLRMRGKKREKVKKRGKFHLRMREKNV